MRISVDRIWENILDYVFPPRCAVCNGVMLHLRDGVCEECRDKITFVEDPLCLKCGKPIDDPGAEFCTDCENKVHYYREGRGVLLYDEYMSKSIYAFKYNGKREYACFYAKLIYGRLKNKIKMWDCEALVPVPVHKSKLKKRGYNQAAILAEELSKLCKIPVREDLISREKSTIVQKNLSAKDRENNLKKAFIIRKNSVKLRSVAIVDDIYTTGSTIDAVAAKLHEAGVENVYFITLCIGRGF